MVAQGYPADAQGLHFSVLRRHRFEVGEVSVLLEADQGDCMPTRKKP
jgi:hypothetical protein